MDRSLDEIIAERPQKQPQNQNQNRGRRPQGRRHDGVKKSYREDRVDLDLDWVHDKYEGDRDSHQSRAPRRSRGDRYSPSPNRTSALSKVRIENLHYDITEPDLEDLFTRIGPILNLTLVYDRAGRSEGVAYVTYKRLSDAKTAVAEFDGANAKGQPIRLTIIPGTAGAGRRDRNPFDNVERPRGSLLDRVQRPRDSRSLSPESPSDAEGGGRRRGRRGGAGTVRRSDVTKPAPDHIDRYIPGQRSPTRRNGGDGRRRGGQRRDDRNRRDGQQQQQQQRTGNGRPRKTQEELDQEMDDYWGGSANSGAGAADQAADQAAAPAEPQQAAPATTAAAGDDDVDMIE